MANPRAHPPQFFLKRFEDFAGPLFDGPYADDSDLVKARLEQEAALEDFAQEVPFSAERYAELRPERAAGGHEHEVFVPVKRRKGARVVKITHRDRWGLLRATPLDYLRRLVLFDRISGTNVCVEGVLMDRDMPRLVTSMDYIEGRHPENIHDKLLERGWEYAPLPGPMIRYVQPKDGLVMLDGHQRNFIETAKGKLVPIDVIFQPLQRFRRT